MSFAATLALVAAYQAYSLPWRADADSALGARAALWGAREIAGLVLASLIAGLATTPFAAYHFHRLAPYGVLANLFAMPVVSAWVMPIGILGVVALPFGFDGLFWPLMGEGIDWMIAVALWVSHLPGAVGHVRAFGIGPLLLATAGLLLLCLLRSPLRWGGAGLAVAAALLALAAPRPDVLVAGDGASAAVRGPDGRLVVLRKGRDTFAIEDWLAADADSRTAADTSLAEGVRCDAVGCVGRLADGRLAAFATDIEAFNEDCRRAAVVISPREGPPDCAALLIDRDVWHEQGAIALYRMGEGFRLMAARPPGFDRPWGHGPTSRPEPGSSDSTPRPENLEAGD
jgi:competence protein ComEC